MRCPKCQSEKDQAKSQAHRMQWLTVGIEAYPGRCNRDPPGEAGCHSESVILWETCLGFHVENRQARQSGGFPPPSALSANVFQICSVLEFLNSTWPGGVDLAVGCYSLGG